MNFVKERNNIHMRTVLNGFYVETQHAYRGHVYLHLSKGSYSITPHKAIPEEDVLDHALELIIPHNALLSTIRLEQMIPKEGGDVAREDIKNIKRALRVHSTCHRCGTPVLTRTEYPCPNCRKDLNKTQGEIK